jgi:hypothetical protein
MFCLGWFSIESITSFMNERQKRALSARPLVKSYWSNLHPARRFDHVRSDLLKRSDALRRQLAAPLPVKFAWLISATKPNRGRRGARCGDLFQYMWVVTERLNLQFHGTVTTTQIERAAHQWARRHVQRHKIKGGFSRKSKSCLVSVATNGLRFLDRPLGL